MSDVIKGRRVTRESIWFENSRVAQTCWTSETDLVRKVVKNGPIETQLRVKVVMKEFHRNKTETFSRLSGQKG